MGWAAAEMCVMAPDVVTYGWCVNMVGGAVALVGWFGEMEPPAAAAAAACAACSTCSIAVWGKRWWTWCMNMYDVGRVGGKISNMAIMDAVTVACWTLYVGLVGGKINIMAIMNAVTRGFCRCLNMMYKDMWMIWVGWVGKLLPHIWNAGIFCMGVLVNRITQDSVFRVSLLNRPWPIYNTI